MTGERIWFDCVTKRDGILLCEWWTANTSGYFRIRRMCGLLRHYRACYEVIRWEIP